MRLRPPCAAVLLAAAACTPDIPRDEVPTLVVAEFDPAATVPVAPKPNDLAIDFDTGLVALPDAPEASEADRLFNRYLRTLDGFPTAASATSSFSAPLDPASVTRSAFFLFDITDPDAIEEVPTPEQLTRCRARCGADAACAAGCADRLAPTITYEEAGRRVRVAASFERERVYAVALLGGEGGLRGAKGEEVVGSPAFFLLRAVGSLVTCEDLSAPDCRPTTSLLRGDSPEERRHAAVTLERARRRLKPALSHLEARNVPRQRVVAAWTFSTVRMGLATFDPAKEVIPFPNDLLIESGRVKLPSDPADDATTAQLKAALNTLDGFSTSASLLTESGDAVGAADARLDARSLDPSQFRLVNLDDPSEEVPVTVACRSCFDGASGPGAEPDQVALTPQGPLRSHTRYAALWLKGARTIAGRPVNATSIFALARMPVPLVANGRSTVEGVEDVIASALEPLRERLQPAMAVADGLGIEREGVLLAWTFTTQTTTDLAKLRAKPSTWSLPTALVGGVGNLADVSLQPLRDVSTLLGRDLHSNLRWAKEGEFTSANALDPAATETDLVTNLPVSTEGAFTAATLATPRLEPRRFILFAPSTSHFPDGRIPVVIFQHALHQSRRDAMVIANTIASAGFATLAIDAPFHGARSYCRANADCRGGSTCVDHRCQDALLDPNDGYRVRILQTPFGNLADPLETPDISGSQFLSTSNLLASRDHFRQQVIDFGQLIRTLEDTAAGLGAIDLDDPATAAVNERLDPARPRLIGMSLGGFIGSLVAAAVPEITDVALNVSGASMTDVILTSPSFAPTKTSIDQRLTALGKPPGSQGYWQFFDLSRWALDPADPQSFGRHYIAEPLEDELTGAAGPRKRIFVSWVANDEVIPNAVTELFIRSIDTGPSPQSFKQQRYDQGGHVLMASIFDPTLVDLALTVQRDALEWVAP